MSAGMDGASLDPRVSFACSLSSSRSALVYILAHMIWEQQRMKTPPKLRASINDIFIEDEEVEIQRECLHELLKGGCDGRRRNMWL